MEVKCKMSKKKIIIISSGVLLVIILTFICFKLFYKPEFYSIDKNEVYLEKTKLEVYDYYSLSEILHLCDGCTLLKDYKVNARELGKQELEVIYLDSDNDKCKGTLELTVLDTTPPYVGIGNHYTHYLGTNFTFYKDILCADNFDRNTKCEIIGDFDETKLGETNLKVKAVDSSNNVTEKEFLLKVVEKPKASSKENNISFEEIEARLPSNASLLIDVSKWDKDIDWKKVASSGVEYVMIRLGTQKALDKESVIDEYFVKNYKGAKNAGLKVGVYYFSYANDVDDAREQAEWVLDKIKDYEIDLPVCFDWESWEYFSEFDISIHDLNEIAKTFLDNIKENGYDVINYSSKSYLESVWDLKEYNTWLAHYTTNTNYNGDFLIWQFTEDGEIPGIKDTVDVNFYYNK